MKVVVCVKTATGAAVNEQDAFQRAGRVGPSLLAPFDSCAVEEALAVVERAGEGEVVVVAIAAMEVLGAIREALALGAHRAVVLSDSRLQGADMLATSRALAALLKRERADLYLTCSWTGDIDGTMLWTAAATRLGLPALTQARRLAIADNAVRVQCQAESGDLTMTAQLPCMVEVTDTINKPRYPTIKGKKAARLKPVESVSLDDLGLEAGAVGASGAGTVVVRLDKPPLRRSPTVVGKGEATPERIVSFLESKGLLG